MRSVVFLCFFSFSTAALALDDCNAKFPNMSQLNDRLKCLQSNNNGLQNQIDALKAEMAESSGKHAIAKPAAIPIAKPASKANKPHETTPQPLTRADCEKVGMQWNNNANVCGVKQATVKTVAKPHKPYATIAQPLTRTDCKKAGMKWNSNANVCGGR
jgi:hypothetical protein